MIDEKKLYKEIEHLESKMREAYRNYQDTGINRYYTQFTKYEDTMNVYERALSAKEDHEAAIAYKAIISKWASELQNIKYMPRERIRKLMPIECFRLQGFDDESFRKAESVCSNSQLYKQAGNSITVDVLCYIFRALDDAKNGIEKYNADKNGQYTFF